MRAHVFYWTRRCTHRPDIRSVPISNGSVKKHPQWWWKHKKRLKTRQLTGPVVFSLWTPYCTVHGDRWDVIIKPNQSQQRWARIRYICRRFRGIVPVKWRKKWPHMRKNVQTFSRSHTIAHKHTAFGISYAIRYSRYTRTVFCIQFVARMATMYANVFLLCDCHSKWPPNSFC